MTPRGRQHDGVNGIPPAAPDAGAGHRTERIVGALVPSTASFAVCANEKGAEGARFAHGPFWLRAPPDPVTVWVQKGLPEDGVEVKCDAPLTESLVALAARLHPPAATSRVGWHYHLGS